MISGDSVALYTESWDCVNSGTSVEIILRILLLFFRELKFVYNWDKSWILLMLQYLSDIKETGIFSHINQDLACCE